MKRFIEGEDRSQSTLFPEHLDDYIAEDNPAPRWRDVSGSQGAFDNGGAAIGLRCYSIALV
jgi:hypothetical protein